MKPDAESFPGRARHNFSRARFSTKLAAVILLVPAIATVPASQWEALALFFPLVVLLASISGVTLRKLAKASMVVLPVFSLVAVQIFFMGRGEGRVLLSEPVRICFYQESLIFAALVLARSLLAVAAATSLLQGTTFREFIAALEELRLPGPVVMSIAIMHNFFYSFRRELYKLSLARLARNVDSSYRRHIALTANSLGVLFMRSLSTSEKIHRAMLVKGYNGTLAGSGRKFRLDYGYVTALAALAIFARVWASLV